MKSGVGGVAVITYKGPPGVFLYTVTSLCGMQFDNYLTLTNCHMSTGPSKVFSI